MFAPTPRALLLFLLLLLTCGGVAAAPQVDFTAHDAHLLHPDEIEILDDPSGEMTLAQARASAWRPFSERRHALRSAGHWLRIELANGAPVAAVRLLSLGLPDAERLEIFRVDGGAATQLVRLGSGSGFSERPLADRLLAVSLALDAGARCGLYIHYRTHGDTPPRLELLTPDAFRGQIEAGDLVNGAVIGILLALCVAALLRYAALRERAHLAYAATMVLEMAFVGQIEGYNFKLLWPALGSWNQEAPVVLSTLVALAHMVFTIALFDMRRRFAPLFRTYLAVAATGILFLLLFVQSGILAPLFVLSLLYVPLPIAVGVQALRRRMAGAGFFLAGALSLMLMVNVLFGLGAFGVGGFDGVRLFTWPKLGYLCEAALFAAALAWRVYDLQRRHEAGLRHRLAEAEQLAQAESEKSRALEAAHQRRLQLAAAGHDLSQPLASIRLAMAALPAPDETSAHIARALDYTTALLRELIEEARTGHGERAQLPLEALLAEAHERHYENARRKGLRLRYCPSGVVVTASRLVLARILDNLIGNALRYTERGKILLGVRRRAGGVEIQVVDTGPGIDAAQRTRLLRPFQQGGAHAGERMGYGLGLHIVHVLCEKSGYRLAIRSVRGRGSVFGVWIPAERAQ